jgi:hypothetical protein
MEATKLKKAPTPSKNSTGQAHGNHWVEGFRPAPVKYDVGGSHTRTQGAEKLDPETKGTGKKL